MDLETEWQIISLAAISLNLQHPRLAAAADAPFCPFFLISVAFAIEIERLKVISHYCIKVLECNACIL